MKKSILWGGITLLASALVQSGCSANDAGSKKTGGSEGTNTGNGSCLAPWCEYAFPHVLNADDGKTYAGVLSIHDNVVARLGFTGHAVIGSEGNCDLEPGADLQFDVALELVSVDSNRSMRFRASQATDVTADLTLTNELELSGTTTVHFTTGANNTPVMVGYTALDPKAESWTTTFAVHGKTSVSCAPDQGSVAIRLPDGSGSTELACQQQPAPPGYAGCNDVTGPTQ